MPERSASRSRRPSLKDVAEEAGVGFGTASRTLSDNGYVAESTRRKVLAAADRLGYRPNRLASGLRSNRSNLVALLVPDYTNEFYSVGSAAAARLLRERGYQLIIAASANPEQERNAIDSLAEYRVDGIVRVPIDPALPVDVPCPVVELNRRSQLQDVSAVLCDDRSGFLQLTEALIERGHREIAMVVGEESFSTTQARVAGYEAALGEAGLSVRTMCGAFDSEWGRAATESLLRSENRPTAIIAASPRIASGAVAACVAHDVQVPDELALVSYDAPEWFSFWGGGIYSFVPPLETMARRAVEILLDRLDHPDALPETVVLPGSIQDGASIGGRIS